MAGTTSSSWRAPRISAPYAPAELSCAFDVEPEPVAVREITPATSSSAPESDDTKPGGSLHLELK